MAGEKNGIIAIGELWTVVRPYETPSNRRPPFRELFKSPIIMAKCYPDMAMLILMTKNDHEYQRLMVNYAVVHFVPSNLHVMETRLPPAGAIILAAEEKGWRMRDNSTIRLMGEISPEQFGEIKGAVEQRIFESQKVAVAARHYPHFSFPENHHLDLNG